MEISHGCCIPRLLSFAACGVFAAMSQAQAPSTTITACVSKFDGFSRIVANPGACLPRFETVVQWNSRGPAGAPGPTGPTGPQGPSGPQGAAGTPGIVLAHTIFISAGGTPEENGQALATALASITSASAANPYLVQLDAGTYTAPPASAPTGVFPLQLPAFVSIKGAGMFSTFINAVGTGFVYHSSASSGTVATLADFTVTSTGGYALSVENLTGLSVDHVQTNGYADFTSTFNGARISIANSIFNGPTSVQSSQGHATLLGTQVLSFYNTFNASGILGCFSVYDANLQPYPAGCVSSAP